MDVWSKITLRIVQSYYRQARVTPFTLSHNRFTQDTCFANEARCNRCEVQIVASGSHMRALTPGWDLAHRLAAGAHMTRRRSQSHRHSRSYRCARACL